MRDILKINKFQRILLAIKIAFHRLNLNIQTKLLDKKNYIEYNCIMEFIDISGIKLQLDLINLRNLQDLLKIGEVIDTKILDTNQNETTINLKGNVVKALSNIMLEKNSTVKLLVVKTQPFIELKILNIDSKPALDLKGMNEAIDRVFSNAIKLTLDDINIKNFGTYIKTSFENISNMLSNNQIRLNDNLFIAIPYYIDGKKFKTYVKVRKKITKHKKQRQMLTVFSETPIGLIKINIIKIESIWCNLWIYDKNAYNLLMSYKEELVNYTKFPVKIILNYNKPILDTIKSVNYVDVVV